MSELGSTIDALRSERVAELPDARLEDDFLELRRAMDQLELESLRRLGELDRRRVFARDGHLSTASWLVSRLRIGWGAAKRELRAARAFERMPITRTAIEGGDLSLAAAHVLVDAQHSDPPAFARSESSLVRAATRHGPRELNRVVWHWRERVMREAGADPRRGPA